jgi:hypothetical protein
MAGNGGIIGTSNAVSCSPVAANNVAFPASGTYNKSTGYPGTGATVMILAGGGGGSSQHAGGGGAGGLLMLTCETVTSGTTVTIGAGGIGSCAYCHTSGTNTTFGCLTAAVGGGRGGAYSNAAAAGGSGGGGAGCAPPVPNTGAAGTACQGNSGKTSPCSTGAGGGGGGKGAGGGGGTPGGCGFDVTPVFGSAPQPFYAADAPDAGPSAPGLFAGGGGGNSGSSSAVVPGGPGGGGDGGGGAPVSGPAFAGTGVANTGGGGGSMRTPGGGGIGKAGGPGIVVVKEAAYNVKVAPGVWQMNTVYEYVKDGNWSN